MSKQNFDKNTISEGRKRSLANLIPPKKGEPSRNPNGRPKKEVCLTSLIKEQLGEVCIKDGKEIILADGTKMTFAHAVAQSIVKQAATGNIYAQKELIDRIDGKVKDELKVDMQAKVTNESREDTTIDQALTVLDEPTRQRVFEALKLARTGIVEGSA